MDLGSRWWREDWPNLLCAEELISFSFCGFLGPRWEGEEGRTLMPSFCGRVGRFWFKMCAGRRFAAGGGDGMRERGVERERERWPFD